MKYLSPEIKKLSHSLLILLCTSVVSAILSSCDSNDDTLQDGRPLSFSFGAIEETRGTRASYEDYSGSRFGVYASLYRPEYNPASNDGVGFMDNEKVTYSNYVCTTEKSYYWVKGDTHFAAYSPYLTDPATNELNITMPQTPYAGYSYSGVVDGRTDYMFSDEQIGGYEDFPNGCVPIIFHHALAKVNFSVKLSTVQDGGTTWALDILSLKLANIRNRGEVSFTHGGETNYNDIVNGALVNKWQSNTDELWSTKDFPSGSAYDNEFLCDMSVNNVSLHVDNTTEHNIGETLYLMPQQLYKSGGSEFVQTLIVEYRMYTTTDGVTKSSDYTVTAPLRTSNITKWAVNQHVLYKLVLEPGGSVELEAQVQPWDVVEFTNQFSNTVTVNEEGRIKWTEGTYNTLNGYDLVLLDDISTPAEMTFTISGPLGGTWQAIFVTKSGDPNAFTLSQSEGEVGKPVTLKVGARQQNTSDISNQAELLFVVRTSSNILPVDALTVSGANYNIIQNINK